MGRGCASSLALIGACGAMLGLANVIGGQTHGVWLTAVTQHRSLPVSLFTLAPTLFYLCAGLTGVLVGRAVDHEWTRAVIITGTGALALGSLVLGGSAQVWQVSLGFVCLGVGFACLGQLTLGKIIARAFHGTARRRAMGLATLGPSLGACLVWLAAFLTARVGLWAAGLLLAALTVGVMAPLIRVLMRLPPRSVPREATGLPGPAPPSPWTLHEAMHTVPWWALAVAVSLVTCAQVGYIIHAVPLYAATFGLLGAGALWALSGLLGALARLAYASLSRPWPTYQLASAVYGLEALGFALLAIGRPPGVLLLAAGIMGAAVSLTVTLEPHVATDTFERTQAYGVLYGRIYLGARVAAALGAFLYGQLLSWTGGYQLTLLLMCGLLTVAALSIRWATPLGAHPLPPPRF